MRRCVHGHLRTEENTRWAKKDGKFYPQCRVCARKRQKLKYRNDAEYREYKKARAMANYRRVTAEAFGGMNGGPEVALSTAPQGRGTISEAAPCGNSGSPPSNCRE